MGLGIFFVAHNYKKRTIQSNPKIKPERKKVEKILSVKKILDFIVGSLSLVNYGHERVAIRVIIKLPFIPSFHEIKKKILQKKAKIMNLEVLV